LLPKVGSIFPRESTASDRDIVPGFVDRRLRTARNPDEEPRDIAGRILEVYLGLDRLCELIASPGIA